MAICFKDSVICMAVNIRLLFAAKTKLILKPLFKHHAFRNSRLTIFALLVSSELFYILPLHLHDELTFAQKYIVRQTCNHLLLDNYVALSVKRKKYFRPTLNISHNKNFYEPVRVLHVLVFCWCSAAVLLKFFCQK